MFSFLSNSQCSRRVVIVGESSDTRDVLCTALTRRGVATYETAIGAEGLNLVDEHHPQVVVLDLEAADDQTRRAFSEKSSMSHANLVVLGNLRRDALGLNEGQFVSKPYHYGPLIRKIEELIDQMDEEMK